MMRAALRLSDQNYRRIEGKLQKKIDLIKRSV